ncbi:hypothetical protein [Emticicia sp. 17c]|uniref:hypothetical protein n=1 Tax=Emticicia sp. 17c TaxID=3127704 RepID=UPI00301DF388
MKIRIKVAQVICNILLALTLFAWLGIHGSGHKIPQKTDISFGTIALLLLITLVILSVLSHRYKNQ